MRPFVAASARRVARALAFLLLLCLPAHARDSYPRLDALDAVHYRLRFDLKDASGEIGAEAEIVFNVNGDLREIPLDFGALAVDSVTVDGAKAAHRREGERLLITLPSPYQRGRQLSVVVKYHGRPTDGLFIKKSRHGDPTVFADNWPNRAHHWFPSIDHPYDKATVEFFVVAPARFDVVANGALIETTSRQDGTRLTHWSERVPVPVYCMVIGATEFAVVNAGSWDGTPLLHYLYPKDRDHGLRDHGRALRMLEYYSQLVGPYPFEKLALVQSSTQFGGMENSSAIFFDEKAYNGTGRLEGTVAHEIAHQWFGDSVTESDWHHLWLSEGFATYFGNLFFEHAEGRERFLREMADDRRRYVEDKEAPTRPVYDPAVTDLFKLLNRNNYQKGAWVLHMLRGLMGDEKFFAGVRDYYRTYRDRTALTEDFRRVMEFHHGRPLDWFFRQWIYEPGHPVYDAAWRWDEAAKTLRLRVAQRQQPTLFRMPLAVEFKTGDTAKRETIEVNQRQQTFDFKLDARPQSVALDPDEWVLKVLTLREE
ncbi:MAG TPA: M1 family metallopeptidase [Pyrinomonadaceae bacterium]|jgi:aminopeptidase N|nr:M1 family metallopeptidase [Pyrinomonadaceae bacterium]